MTAGSMVCSYKNPTNKTARSGHPPVFFAKCPFGRMSSVVDIDRPVPPSTSTPAMETKPTPVPYLLFFRNSGPETHQHLSPEERQRLVTRWNAWYDGLAAEGKAVEGQPLELETRLVSGPGGRVVDGPFAEAKEAIGGYVKLLVSGLEEATEIARRHPGLAYGLIIEVRSMTAACHLGVTAGRRAAASSAH